MNIKRPSHTDLRRYRRMALDLPVRVTVNGIDDYDGQLVNISPGDLALKVDGAIVVGDVAIVHISGLDFIEGRVARIFPDGFAMSYRLSKSRRALLIEQLMLRLNEERSSGLGDRRGALRHPSGNQRVVCRLPDGGSLIAAMRDQSVDGVSLEASRRPPVGASVHVGRARGIVSRHTPRGFVVVFESPPTEESAHLRAV